MKARFVALCKEMGIFPLLVLVPPDTACAVAVDIGKTNSTCGLGLDFHDTLDIGIHVAAIGELHESKLVGERGWTYDILGFLALDDGSGGRGNFGLHFGRGIGASGFGPASWSQHRERTKPAEAVRLASRKRDR